MTSSGELDAAGGSAARRPLSVAFAAQARIRDGAGRPARRRGVAAVLAASGCGDGRAPDRQLAGLLAAALRSGQRPGGRGRTCSGRRAGRHRTSTPAGTTVSAIAAHGDRAGRRCPAAGRCPPSRSATGARQLLRRERVQSPPREQARSPPLAIPRPRVRPAGRRRAGRRRSGRSGGRAAARRPGRGGRAPGPTVGRRRGRPSPRSSTLAADRAGRTGGAIRRGAARPSGSGLAPRRRSGCWTVDAADVRRLSPRPRRRASARTSAVRDRRPSRRRRAPVGRSGGTVLRGLGYLTVDRAPPAAVPWSGAPDWARRAAGPSTAAPSRRAGGGRACRLPGGPGVRPAARATPWTVRSRGPGGGPPTFVWTIAVPTRRWRLPGVRRATVGGWSSPSPRARPGQRRYVEHRPRPRAGSTATTRERPSRGPSRPGPGPTRGGGEWPGSRGRRSTDSAGSWDSAAPGRPRTAGTASSVRDVELTASGARRRLTGAPRRSQPESPARPG